VRTAYTEGFHPKPNMSFTPALPLGAASLAEYVDISLIDAPAPDVLLERLNRATTPGLRFVGAAQIDSTDLSISRVVDEAVYILGIPETSLGARAEECRLIVAAKVRDFLAESAQTVVRDVQGIKRKLDAKKGLLHLELGGTAAERALFQAGIVGRLIPLELHLKVDPSGSVRPREVVEALGLTGPVMVVRSELRRGGHLPLELEHHKKPLHQPRSRDSLDDGASADDLLPASIVQAEIQMDY
jgi:radical SAM-linked protein